MEFTPTSAATMAQILAIVMLATAFDPMLRGSLATRYLKDADGYLHKIPALGTGRRRHFGRFRLFAIFTSLVAIMLDSMYFIVGIDFGGPIAFSIALVNSFALGLIMSEIAFAALQHLRNDDAHDGGEQGYETNKGNQSE